MPKNKPTNKRNKGANPKGKGKAVKRGKRRMPGKGSKRSRMY